MCLSIYLSVYLSIYLSIYVSVCLSVCLSFHLSTPQSIYSPLLGLGRFFSFLISYTVGRSPWTRDQLVARPLSAYRTTQTRNKRTQIAMPQVGFEPTIPVFGRAKTIHALDLAATVVGIRQVKVRNYEVDSVGSR
jgi:hypothetical protein